MSLITGKQISKVYLGNKQIYSNGSTVNYYVEGSVARTQEVDSGADILDPSTVYKPTKSGWNFVGWRKDTVASGDVEISVIMGDEPINLYAVFERSITVTFKSYNKTEYVSGSYYYNGSGSTSNPSITAPNGADYPGWTWRGWSFAGETSANAGVNFGNGFTWDGGSTHTRYGLYEQSITLSYNGNGHTSGSVSNETKTRYYNAYGNTSSNPSFTLKANGYSKTSYTFAKWAMGSTSGTLYTPGASVTLSSNTTFYAYWALTTKSFGYTGGIQSYSIPVTGTYKLVAYGAKGGNRTGSGGNGGYSYGNAYLTAGTTLYVVVGGAGSGGSGGYNGGGSSSGSAGGGGATHIAKASGLLSSLSGNRSSILIVAGGGGGGSYYSWYDSEEDSWSDAPLNGGSGGGTNGGAGSGGSSGGTQSSGYAFGSGQSGWGGAGGGGYYGGYNSGVQYQLDSGGGGGSGYIGGVTGGSTSNGANGGNGSASITLVSVA